MDMDKIRFQLDPANFGKKYVPSEVIKPTQATKEGPEEVELTWQYIVANKPDLKVVRKFFREQVKDDEDSESF